MLTCLRQKIVVDNLPRLAYNATTRLERVANADMAELADAHGSDTVTSVKNRGESVHPHPVIRAGPKKAKKHANADMAELADAHGSGPCESSLIQVQVLLSALKNSLEINVSGLFSFLVSV